MFTADEMLYPSNYRVPRSTSQATWPWARAPLRTRSTAWWQAASRPVGMKNPTGGSPAVMLNSIYAAQAPQDFIFRNWEVHTTGNPLAHALLRGFR